MSTNQAALSDLPPAAGVPLPAAGIHILRCLAGSSGYCFDMAEVRGIERWESVREGPPTFGAIGRLAWGGKDIAVFRLKTLLGGGLSDGLRGPILVLGHDKVHFGVQVDRVFHSSSAMLDVVLALPKRLAADAWPCLGAVRIDGGLLICLAAGRLHPDPRWHWPSTHQAVAARTEIPRRANAKAAASKMLCFAAGESPEGVETFCGISYYQIIEVAQGLKITRVPGLGEAHPVLGLIDWRGAAIPVANLSACLDLRNSPEGREGLFAIARGVRQLEIVALPLRDFSTVTFPLDNETLRAEPADPGRLIKAAFQFAGGARRLVIPDLDPILGG